jgi:hypothetical protein
MKSKMRMPLLVIWFSLLGFVVFVLWTPIPFQSLKIAFLLSILCIITGAYYLFCRQRTLIGVVGLLVVLGSVVIGFWPQQAHSIPKLQSAYVASLRSYIGTKYVWGGENARGIDCSGLVRRAMLDALLSRGWQEKNPSLWRSAAEIWWNDCAARNMKEGEDGRYGEQFAASNLNQLAYSRLSIGDLAVTKSGVHVLAFVGGKTWIQADPNLVNGGDKVILTTAPSESGWFKQGIVICRWTLLNP